MRIFTAIFYLLFFTLTAWGQTRWAEYQKAAHSHVCAGGLSLKGENNGIQVKYQTVAASSLKVSVR